MFFQKSVYRFPYLITGLLFYFTLSLSLLATTFDRVVAKVNNDVITLWTLENRVEAFLQKNNGSNSLVQPLQKKEVMKLVLKDLVAEKLQVQEAKKNGMLVSDETLEKALGDIYKNNNITSEEFETMLKNEGSNLDSYKEIIRDQILSSRIVTRQLSNVGDAKESSMKKYYQKNKKSFWVPEQLVVRHIMFIKEEGSSAKDNHALKKKAGDILKKIKAGENFSVLAKNYSTDLSARSGGLLGVISRGTMMPEFEKAAFDLKVGEVSGVVETMNGFHIIKCDNVIPGHTKKYKLVRPEIKKILNAKIREKKYKKWINGLKKTSFVEISLFEDIKSIKKVRVSRSIKRNQANSSKPVKSKLYLKNKKEHNQSETLTRERLIEKKLRMYRKLYSNGKITKETFLKKKKEVLESL